MKHLYSKLTKKTFVSLFLGISLLLGSQGIHAITYKTIASGSWSDTATWDANGIPVTNVTSHTIIISAGHTVNLTLVANFTVGAINIESGATLNVSQDATARSFTIGVLAPGSTITGALLFDASVTGTKSFGKVTVTATGSVIETTLRSISMNNGASGVLTNYGTITTGTLAMSGTNANLMKIDNYGTINSTGFSSSTVGTFTNFGTGILNINGAISGNTDNFGTINSSALSGSSAVANITNKSTGILNFTGGSMSSTTLVLDASEAGNTVNYSAAITQTIKPATYYNLTLSGSSTKNVAATTIVTIASGGVGTVNEGIVLNNLGTVTNNGELLLKSSATGTASLTSTSSIIGVTQQRYLSSNQRGWRLISNPLASTTFNTIATASGITIGTNFTGEYVSSSNTWTSTDGTATMDTQKAYKVFITGLTGQSPAYATGPSNVTLVNKGTAANTAPGTINTVAGQYYLIANPYTAPISMIRLRGASTGLSATVAYYNPTIASSDVKVKAGGYDTVTLSGSTAGSATDVVIPAMGAIFVQASTAGTINIPDTNIFTGTPAQSGTYNHKSAAAKIASNALQLEVKSNGTYYDKVVLQFKPVGDAGSNIDFGKLPNDILNVYSIAGTQKMAVSELELAPQTIPLGITSTSLKNYTFSVAENTIAAGYEAVLVDNLLNTSTVLAPGASYNFAIDSNAASKGDARFAINLKTTGTLSVVKNELDSKIDLWPNPARGQFNILNTLNQQDGISTIEISNINGQMIHSQKSNPGTTTTVQTNDWAAGVYILKATNNGAQTTKKLIIQ